MDHQGNQLGQMETQEVHLQSRKKCMDKVREYFPKVDVCCSDGTFERAVVPSGCLLVLVAVVHVLPPHTAPLLATLRGWLATLFMKLWLGTSLGGRLWLGTSLGAAS